MHVYIFAYKGLTSPNSRIDLQQLSDFETYPEEIIILEDDRTE